MATAFVGGRILTMDDSAASAEAVVIHDDRIVAVGDPSVVASWPQAEQVRLGDRWLLPGFIDAHNHLSLRALHPLWVDLAFAASASEVVAAFDRVPPTVANEGTWLRGHSWGARTLVPLSRHDLDRVSDSRPVIAAHSSIHMAVVNSVGLEMLGIGRGTPDPVAGAIERDARGQPTGVLIEAAWSDANRTSQREYAEPGRWGDHIVARAEGLLAEGITCVHDPTCSPTAEAIYRALEAERRLPIGVVMMPHSESLFSGPPPGRLEGPPTGEGSEQLRVGPVKLFADGGVDPFVDPGAGASKEGTLFPDIAKHIQEATERRFRVAVHAMGNAGLEETLSAFRSIARAHPDEDLRMRVEHATLASAQQIDDLVALGAIAVVQPSFIPIIAFVWGHRHVAEATWAPFASLARRGVALAASSDDPCAHWKPLKTSAWGVLRPLPGGDSFLPEESLPYEDWLRAYTAGAAYAGGQERERGTITPGKRADLVVLDGELDPQHPPRVVETWVGGTRAYAAPDAE